MKKLFKYILLSLFYCLWVHSSFSQSRTNSSSSNWLFVQVEDSSDSEISSQANTLYFDKNNMPCKPGEAYYFRLLPFENFKSPEGIVKDYYSNTLKLKFSGRYYKYNIKNETANTSFQGECDFYEENGIKTTKTYLNGQIKKEKTFNLKGQIIYEALYNDDLTKKYFISYYYDSNGKQNAIMQGKYNPISRSDDGKKRIFYPTGEAYMDIDYENGCPKSIATFYTKTGDSYPVVIQEFVCDNPKEWFFINDLSFRKKPITNPNENTSSLHIKSLNDNIGVYYTSISNNFSKKPIEISFSFEQINKANTPEIGIVWQYQSPQNYAYFTVNLLKNTYEINAIVNGEKKKYMLGFSNKISPTLLLQSHVQLRIFLDPNNDVFQYWINDTKLDFNKFPQLFIKENNSWNIGCLINPIEIGNEVELNKLEIKMY